MTHSSFGALRQYPQLEDCCSECNLLNRPKAVGRDIDQPEALIAGYKCQICGYAWWTCYS